MIYLLMFALEIDDVKVVNIDDIYEYDMKVDGHGWWYGKVQCGRKYHWIQEYRIQDIRADFVSNSMWNNEDEREVTISDLNYFSHTL